MKKLYFIFFLLLIGSVVYAQRVKINPNVQETDRVLYQKTDLKAPDFKYEGEVFYTETFDFADPSDDRGWSLPEGWQIVDENDMGHYWEWRAGTDSILGRFSFEPGHKFSLSPEDGYIVLPMDEYNFRDGVSSSDNGWAWIQMAPIDCSGRGSVVMKFRQYFRTCCAGSPNLKVRISNDQGVHWADYNMAFGTPTNTFCKNPYVEVNISNVAAGMPDVWVRFEWDDNRRYFWCIDDFELSEGYTNELQLEDTWVMMSDLSDEDQDEGFVFMTPLSQINDVLGGWTFNGAFLNAGSADQYDCTLNAEIWKNGTSVHTASSDAVEIWTLDRDTVYITDPYFPDEYGSYEFKLTATQEQEDGVPTNNDYSDWFHVTDSVYSMSDWDFETYSSTASWGNNDGDFLGIVYDVTQECEVNSMSVFIQQRPENPTASTQVGYSFQYFIFYYDEDEENWFELISSEWWEVEEDMINTWVTLPMEKDGESEFLFPGQYIAAIQVFHGGGDSPDNNLYRFTIGSDLDHKYHRFKSVFQLIDGDGSWYVNTTDLSMIRMNLAYSGAPMVGTVEFNVDMNIPITNGYFHPEWGDFVDISGTINGWGDSDHMEDSDGDGIYTLTVEGIPVFENIEYKYRINANWDTSEFPMGGPNRVYRTHYYNVTDDEYNDGVALSVDPLDMTQSLKVYPNPSSGDFTLDVQLPQATDLHISVMNIHGQVIHQNQVSSVLNHRENIDLSHCAKGMYFIKVNNTVTKLLVK